MIGFLWLAIRALDLIDFKNAKNSCSGVRLYLANHRSVVRMFLIEFQEAQCFFVIAIQIAFIFSMSAKPELYGAASLRQLYLNIAMTRAVCHMALASVTFGLWLIQTTNAKSLYTFICSSITIFLSIAAFHMVGHWLPSPDNVTLPKNDRTWTRCGFHSPPLVWCADRYGYQEVTWFLPIAVSLFCFSMCCTLFDLLSVGPLAKQYLRDSDFKWLQNAYHCVNGLLFSSKKANSRWSKLLRALGFCIDIIILATTLVSMVISGSEVELVPNEWNLGQVMAVTIWAPPIVKYFYWSLCESHCRDILCSQLNRSSRGRVLFGHPDSITVQNHKNGFQFFWINYSLVPSWLIWHCVYGWVCRRFWSNSLQVMFEFRHGGSSWQW